MANFQAEKLRRYIQDSIALTMMATGRDKQRTMELIVEEMGDIRTVAALRKWAEKRRTSPIDASLLSRFAWVCLQHVRRWVQPTNWVTDLFAANGMGPEDMSPMLRQALAARLAGRPAIVARDLAVLRDEYVAHLTMWAGSRRVIAGTSGHQHQGTRPSRLVRQSLPGSGSGDRPVLGMEDELLDIGDLLQGQPRRVAILGPAGRGKSTLWRHLAGQLAQGPASLGLPVPLDWDDVTSAAVDTVTTLLQAAIHRTWPQCPLHEQQVLAFYLEDRLRQGTAVALIDNWRRLHPLARSQADRWRAALASWPRLIILSRYAPGPDDVTIQLFDLHGLDDHAIAHFVRDWPASTGRVLDPAAVLAQVTQATALRDLAPEPLFLNLMCTVAARQPDGPIGRCTVLDGALAELTTHETRGSQPAADADLRAALAELAWAGYWREHPDRPVQRSFDSAQVGDLWRAKLGERGQWLCGLVRERGLLRRAPGDNQLAFPHEALQAALAAEAWLRQPDWLEHLCAVKSQPPWADVIVCAAARLGHEGRLVELERLLGRLCAPEGSDVLALHW
ncbi:MAG: hypothetical protein KJ734_09090, partial [Chloroflexi bacterium]|nr:hypothetical protein [Chloroflexota bacterium]